MFPFNVPDGQDPEEYLKKIQAAYKEQQDKEQMKAQDESHELLDWMGSLEQHDLVSLLMLMRRIERNGIQEVLVITGMVSGRLKFEFGLCPGCGRDHAEEFLKEASHGEED